MGHPSRCTIVYVGLGRLPQPLVAAAPTVAVELEVELGSRQVVAANTNLPFPSLARLLDDVLVGKPVEACMDGALLEFDVRYSAPFASAVRVAVQAAARRALADAADSEGLADRESLQVQSRQPGRADPERHGREPLQRAGEPTVALS